MAFIETFAKKNLGIVRREKNQYYYPVLNSKIPKIEINMKAIAIKRMENQVVIQIYTNGIFNYFEIRNKLRPFERSKLMVTQMSLTDYKINIPLETDLRDYEFWVIYNDYQDQKIERIEKLLSE